MWPMGLLFTKTSAVKQYSYENDFSSVFDALHQISLLTPVPVESSLVWSTCGPCIFGGGRASVSPPADSRCLRQLGFTVHIVVEIRAWSICWKQ